MEWYALFVQADKEMMVENRIHALFNESVCTALVPKRMLLERRQGVTRAVARLLFPSYVLIKTTMQPDIYYRIMEIPYILKILNTGIPRKDGCYWTAIDPGEIETILNLVDQSGVICSSRVLMEDRNFYVEEGPLLGMEDRIMKLDNHHNRAKVRLNFNGESKTVDLAVNVFRKNN